MTRSRRNSRQAAQHRPASRPFTHLAVILVSIGVAVYAMFATRGPTISADGLQATADLSSPATASQPMSSSSQYQSSVASIQGLAPNAPLDQQGRLDTLNAATSTPTGISSSLAPSPTATSTPVPDCVPATSDLYCVYTVKAGDTLSAIAKRFGITSSGELSPAEILALSNKPAVVETNSIETGLKLRIPTQSGVLHTVFANETLSDVAVIYGVDAEDIEAANAIGASGLLVGQNILVPDPQYQKLPTAPAAAALETETATPEAEATEEAPAEEATEAPTEAVETPTPEASATARPATSTPRRGTATPTPKPAGSPSRSGFIWPAQGPISSYFGPAHPLGIDIDFYANPNQAVVAVKAGTVTFAGGDPCCSYGYYVIVDHGDGFVTLYAHFSSIAVTAGQKVTQGQKLGNGGHTGYATGDHLHFEVHLNGVIVNPLTYLP